MLIIKTEEDRERCTSCYGNRTIVLSMEEVLALFSGATLGDPNFNEYGVFIRLEGSAPVPLKGHEELQNYKEMFEQLKKIMEEKHSVTVCELCNIHDCGDSDEEHCKECQFYKYSKWVNWKKANPVIDEFERKGYTRTVDGNKIVYTKEDDAETNEGLNKHFGGIEE